MLRARHEDVEFEELGTTDELEALNRSVSGGASSAVLDVSKVRAHLRQHHDLPSTSSFPWPSVASPMTPSDAASQHPPLFLVKLPPRCPPGSLASPSKPSVLPSHDPMASPLASSLASPRPRKPRASRQRRSFKAARHSAEFSVSSRSATGHSGSGSGQMPSPMSSPISSSSSASSQSSVASDVGILSHRHDVTADAFSDADRHSSPSPPSSPSSSSAAASALSSLPSSSTARSRVKSPQTNPLPHPHSLPRARSESTLHAAGRTRSRSWDVTSKHPTAVATSSSSTSSISCTLTQRRPRSCHTSPQTALTLMDEYFLERIATHVSLLEKMRERCCADGRSNGPVVAVTNWQHAEDYPPAWVATLKELITDPRFPEPMYLETDADADDDEVEGVLMSLIRNEDVAAAPHARRRRMKSSLSPYSNPKSPYHVCFGRFGSLLALLILLVLVVSLSQWYTRVGTESGHSDHAGVGNGVGIGPGHSGHGSFDGH